jgi:hypothetical protein
MAETSKSRWTLTNSLGSAFIGALVGVLLGSFGTVVAWWLVGIVLGHGADGDVALVFYGFLAVLLGGFSGLVAGPILARRWWTRRSPLRF